MTVGFGQTSVQIFGRYLPYAIIGALIVVLPALASVWLLSRLHDTLNSHRLEVSKFLSTYQGKQLIEEHITALMEHH